MMFIITDQRMNEIITIIIKLIKTSHSSFQLPNDDYLGTDNQVQPFYNIYVQTFSFKVENLANLTHLLPVKMPLPALSKYKLPQ